MKTRMMHANATRLSDNEWHNLFKGIDISEVLEWACLLDGIDIFEMIWYIYFIFYLMDDGNGRIYPQKRESQREYYECGA